MNAPSDASAKPALAKAGPAWRSRRAMAIFAAVFLGLLALDLVVKDQSFEHVTGQPVVLTQANAGARETIPLHEPVTVVPHMLSLRLTTNTGAVFGLGKGQRWFFVGVSIVATLVILRVFAKSPASAWLTHLCLAAILAGALGNLYDRVVYGAVRDMLYLFPGVHLPFGWQWPQGNPEIYPWIFNIADVALVVGVLTLMVIMWRGGKPEPDAESVPD